MEDIEAKNTTTCATFPLFSFSNPNANRRGIARFGGQLGAGGGRRYPIDLHGAISIARDPVKHELTKHIGVDASYMQTQGRVNTSDVFGVKNSDLVPGKYEGGLKLWEGSLDFVKTLNSDIKDDRDLVEDKCVLEMGCGHGLPGIFAGLKRC